MTGDPEKPTEESVDRRQSRRRSLEEHSIVCARVRPGMDVALVDVSAGGALVETIHRLLPGSAIELQLDSGERRAAVRGRVLRCAVAGLRSGAVWYRGAIGFDRHLPWFLERDSGNQVPDARVRARRPIREDTTHGVL